MWLERLVNMSFGCICLRIWKINEMLYITNETNQSLRLCTLSDMIRFIWQVNCIVWFFFVGLLVSAGALALTRLCYLIDVQVQSCLVDSQLPINGPLSLYFSAAMLLLKFSCPANIYWREFFLDHTCFVWLLFYLTLKLLYDPYRNTNTAHQARVLVT